MNDGPLYQVAPVPGLRHHLLNAELLSTTPRPVAVQTNLSETDYNLLPGVRSSWLKQALRSPAHLYQSVMTASEPTAAQKNGILCHHALLMGMESLPVHTVADDLNLNSKEGRAAKEHAEQWGLFVVRDSELARIKNIRETLLCDPEIAAILQSPFKETSIACDLKHPSCLDELHIRCKARFDVIPDGDFLFDLKVVNDARPDPFAYKIVDFGYDMQAAHYLNVWNGAAAYAGDAKTLLPARFIAQRTKFLFVAIEAEPPHAFSKFMLSPEFLNKGIQNWMQAVETITTSLRSGHFDAYPNLINILRPPVRTTDRFVQETV